MIVDASLSYLSGLVDELRKQPAETEWLEFKENMGDPQEIGEYLSALSNAAALRGKTNGYLVWGIENGTHDVKGTTFKLSKAKKGGEDLEPWLMRMLTPHLYFVFREFEYQGQPVVLLEIPRASTHPVAFSGVESIRIGSHRKKLKDHPHIEQELWRIFERTPFEEITALEDVDGARVLELLDYQNYFALLAQPQPETPEKILERLANERLIVRNEAGRWNISNLGAILFARDLDDFRTLQRKAARVVVYDGPGRLRTFREPVFRKGYACGFEELIALSNPPQEVIGRAIRREQAIYPPLAVRELVANALIHQDFRVTGSGPIIEIFSDRMEITNPGIPLVEIDRLLNNPPRSRNEDLASFMRRIGICEERGSGVDKVVSQTEAMHLPAPLFEALGTSTRAVLFMAKPLRAMERDDQVRACYLHACLRYEERNPMTNSSLRERFEIEEHNSAIASRIIRAALEEGKIRPYDENQGKKYAKYLPSWA